ncbi:MAG TPA: DUF305 domain-containing protein [Gemmatimonadaceae bacterium]|jgi:uncharacterized protein (DUF305 family)|nr:DUF305 domain-containing protein [Gemmatimonadaceae bacterium]
MSAAVVAVVTALLATVAMSCEKSRAVAAAPASATGDVAAAGSPLPFTPADVSFMQGMIGHHAQAIRMAAMAPTHGASAKVLLLCKKIDISQRDEINMMEQWLNDRHQTAPDPNTPMAMPMPGMLTAAQMKELDAARDTTFDRLFLTFMIQHHQGAIAMVKTLFGTPGGGEAPEMYRYASDVNSDQSIEIERMQNMLSSKSSSTSSSSESPSESLQP